MYLALEKLELGYSVYFDSGGCIFTPHLEVQNRTSVGFFTKYVLQECVFKSTCVLGTKISVTSTGGGSRVCFHQIFVFEYLVWIFPLICQQIFLR